MRLTNVRTSVHESCPTQACQIQDPSGCRLPSHGEDIGGCGTDTFTWRASASGLTRAQLTTGDSHADVATGDCSTLEDRAVNASRLDLTMARSSAGHGFWGILPASSAQEDAARRDLRKNAKLMYELGITSQGVTQQSLRDLYVSAPADEPSCGVSAQTPVSDGCRSFGVTNQLVGPLGRCQRMLSSHVVSSVFLAELDGCLDLLARTELAGTGSCAVEYRTVVETLTERMLARSLSALQKPVGTTGIQGLGTTLSRIDRWYTGAALAFASDAAALADARGRVLQAFWARAYAVGAAPPIFALGEAGSETARSQLAQLFSDRIETDRQVLAAAYANPPPLDEVPLLLITGDALSSLGERLRTAAPLYDFACRIKDGCTIANANEATRILRIIGAIGDATELTSALDAGANDAVRADWHNVFTALQAKRDALQVAYGKATGRSTANLDELYQPNVIAVAATLAELVAGANQMWTSYASHGVLLPRDGNVVRTSLVDSKIVDTLQAFRDSRDQLRLQREDYQRTRGDFARTILDRIANQQFATRISAEIAVLQAEYNKLANDLEGLTTAQDQAEQVIGKFLTTYTERARQPGWFPDFPIGGNPVAMTISALAARGTGQMATDVTTVAVRDPEQSSQPWTLDVARGDMLTFEVDGLWAPTCALRSTTLAGPNGTVGFHDPTHAFVGPEGFSIVFENGAFTAKEHQSSDFTSRVDQQTICGAISAGVGAGGGGGGGGNSGPFASLSGSATACRQWTSGHSESDNTSNGARFQSSASFAGGLRVPGTPFPTFPGGSLLLVEAVDGPGGAVIRDVHVVRPHSTFLFPEDAHLYLVANDKGGCGSVDVSQALSVTYVHAQAAATAARDLAEGMANVLASLSAQKPARIAQGSVTPAELLELQNAAYDQLRASCNCVLSAFPEEVIGMFDAWLTAELASFERGTRLAAAQHTLDTLVLRLAALQEDLAGNADSSRLLSLLTTWQLGHLAFPQLRSYANQVLTNGNDNMLPIMRIMYPQTLTMVQGLTQVELLRTFDWTLPYDEQVNKLEIVADAVKAQIDNARLTGGQAIAPVAIAFPKPSAPGTPLPDLPGVVFAAPERRNDVWEQCQPPRTGFCLRREPIFTIAPEDVYGESLVGLGCQEAAPVVQGFAIIAVNNANSGNTDWNLNPRRADIFRAADVKFPTEMGVLGYRMEGPLAPARVRVLATEATELASSFATFVRPGNDLQGVSAFGSFAVDLGDTVDVATSPLGSATTVVVYFDAQTRTASGPLHGVGVCAQSGGPDGSPPAGDDDTLVGGAGDPASSVLVTSQAPGGAR